VVGADEADVADLFCARGANVAVMSAALSA
jgi:hypothetical protein